MRQQGSGIDEAVTGDESRGGGRGEVEERTSVCGFFLNVMVPNLHGIFPY
jgi:hypothetical protein